MTYYVRMHDKFMSGWGGAEGRRAMLVIECDTLAQAEAIEKAAHCRDEMKFVSVLDHSPRLRVSDQITWRKFDDMHGPWKAYWREIAA